MEPEHTVREDLFSLHYNDWPQKLDDLLAMLVSVREAVPEAYRGEIVLRFEGGYYSNSGTGWLEASYKRPETDRERDARLKRERRRLEAEERREQRAQKLRDERAEYKALKAKHG